MTTAKPAPGIRKKAKPGGKVLRIKQGYNPNSSSMGSVIFVLPAALLGLTALFGAVSGFLSTILLRRFENPGNKITALYMKRHNKLLKSSIQEKSSE
jgi:hypothetical protein